MLSPRLVNPHTVRIKAFWLAFQYDQCNRLLSHLQLSAADGRSHIWLTFTLRYTGWLTDVVNLQKVVNLYKEIIIDKTNVVEEYSEWCLNWREALMDPAKFTPYRLLTTLL